MAAVPRQPWFVRICDPIAMLCYGLAYVGGGGIVAYQAYMWIIYTTFNYMSLDWAFRQLDLPFVRDPGSWYNNGAGWPQVHHYLTLFFQWMPLSLTIFLIGVMLGRFIDNWSMDYERSHIIKGDPYENL